jgi:hypothetical protein
VDLAPGLRAREEARSDRKAKVELFEQIRREYDYTSFPVRPKIRSFRIGSRSFHRASAKHIICLRSLIPAKWSSFQR